MLWRLKRLQAKEISLKYIFSKRENKQIKINFEFFNFEFTNKKKLDEKNLEFLRLILYFPFTSLFSFLFLLKKK